MRRAIHLPLYGTIEHGPEDDLAWDLYQSEALTRLRDISLSSAPSRFTPHGVAASRFQHSVGVGHLAKILSERHSEFAPFRELLITAALCHDAGSPPFSHISEIFMYDLIGRTHEEQTIELLSPTGELKGILDSYGVKASEVVEVITGRHQPLGPVLAGSIDLDNLDNSLHLLVSMGYHQRPLYHPLELVNVFRLKENSLHLDSAYLSEVLAWDKTRTQLYRILQSDALLSSSSMLYRALEFAYQAGGLDQTFFNLGESEALYYLSQEAPRESRLLVERALRWRQYPVVYQQEGEEDPRLATLYSNWRLRKEATDQLAEALKLPAEDLSLYVGRSKDSKQIHHPWMGDKSEGAQKLFPGRKGKQLVSVFVKKSHRIHNMKSIISGTLKSLTKDLPESSPNSHIFF